MKQQVDLETRMYAQRSMMAVLQQLVDLRETYHNQLLHRENLSHECFISIVDIKYGLTQSIEVLQNAIVDQQRVKRF